MQLEHAEASLAGLPLENDGNTTAPACVMDSHAPVPSPALRAPPEVIPATDSKAAATPAVSAPTALSRAMSGCISSMKQHYKSTAAILTRTSRKNQPPRSSTCDDVMGQDPCAYKLSFCAPSSPATPIGAGRAAWLQRLMSGSKHQHTSRAGLRDNALAAASQAAAPTPAELPAPPQAATAGAADHNGSKMARLLSKLKRMKSKGAASAHPCQGTGAVSSTESVSNTPAEPQQVASSAADSIPQ